MGGTVFRVCGISWISLLIFWWSVGSTIIHCARKTLYASFYAPAILNVCVCGGGGVGVGEGGRWRSYSITAVRPVRPVRNTNGFRAISFEKLGVLD